MADNAWQFGWFCRGGAITESLSVFAGVSVVVVIVPVSTIVVVGTVPCDVEITAPSYVIVVAVPTVVVGGLVEPEVGVPYSAVKDTAGEFIVIDGGIEVGVVVIA